MDVPQILADRYAIEREIGRGGMAVVYLARDLRHVRDVAVKVFHLTGPAPEEGAQRFLQEIQIAARLSHPNILPLHDSGEADGLLYYVMPYVPGESLRQRLEREGALPVADALTVASEVAGALAYAHSHGVIHRDIKPENILFIAGHAVVADFGIARAISAGGWDSWKLAGPAGTPTYMSPEQARGGSRVDGRSDVYSLGCVLYELLTGEPPFRGTTPEEVAVQHLEAEPLPVQTRRPTLPRELQAAVVKALAKHPADRYQTAQQMMDALTRLEAAVGAETSGVGGSLRQGPPAGGQPARAAAETGWVRRWAAPSFAAAGIAFAIFWTSGSWPGAALDPGVTLVGPFVHREGVPAMLSGDQCSRLVYQALNRWQDVHLTDARWTEDQLARLDDSATLDDLLAIARRGRAGRLISGEVWSWDDSIRVRGALYDVRRGARVLRELTVTLAPDLADAERKFAELADSLLLPPPQEAAAASGVLGTRTIAAWQAYDSGHVALAQWNLEAAAEEFRESLRLDPQYHLAHLWLAQTLNWMGGDPDVWREQAIVGLEGSGLSTEDRQWGQALLALAEGRYQDACRQYEAMVRRDSLDFQGWYGRGECRRLDRTVERDGTSPSGWRFRASYHTAIRDYERALKLIPSTHRAFRGAAFGRLREMFYTETNVIRGGVPAGTDSLVAGAFPSLQGDTLAFVPYPLEQVVRSEGAAFPASTPAAVSLNRERLTRVSAEWARAFPASSAALEAYATALELQGRLDGADSTQPWALGQYRRARQASGDTTARLDAALGQARILVKLGRYPAARALADTLLARSATASGNAAGALAGLAALTGRPLLAADLARRAGPDTRFMTTSGEELKLPNAIKGSALAYLALAAFQAPVDSLRAVDREILRQIETAVERRDRTAVINATVAVPRSLAYPAMGPGMTYQGSIGGSSLLLLQANLLRGDTASVHRSLTAAAGPGRAVLASEVPLDLVLRQSQILLLLGDTSAARTRLDQALSALPLGGLGLLGDEPHISIPQAAAVPLALALGAEMAADRGDRATARRMAGDVLALVDQHSEPLQPLVERLRKLSDPSQPQ